MEKLTADVRALHDQVRRLDSLLHQAGTVTDLADKRADAAHDQAERNNRRIRRLFAAGLVAAFLWTPATAYFAMWMHERVRNTCLPSSLLVDYVNGDRTPDLTRDEPWYCDLFPGTGHPEVPPAP